MIIMIIIIQHDHYYHHDHHDYDFNDDNDTLDRIRYTMVKNQVLNMTNDDFDQVMDFNWANAAEPDFLKASFQVMFKNTKRIFKMLKC